MSKNSWVKCYQNNKERLQKEAREWYQSFFKEEKEEKQQYGRERYKKFTGRWKTKACWV